MKNPDNKPLRIVLGNNQPRFAGWDGDGVKNYVLILSNLAIAQSNLVRAGKDSAMPHFIAIIKEIERAYDFKFEIYEEK